MKKRVIWIGKGRRYQTRMLRAGDVVDLPAAEANVLEKLGKVKIPKREPPREVPPPPPELKPSDVDALRDQARSIGLTVDRRWGAPRLKQEIEGAASS